MAEADIPGLIAALDQASDSAAEDAREKLVPLGPALLPHAAEGYGALRSWRGRRALVYTVIKFARRHDAAVDLALRALADRSARVRSTACAVLAFSLRRDVVPALSALRDDPDRIVTEDAAAAIDAITRGSHHYFLDRDHTGRVRWEVGGSEDYL